MIRRQQSIRVICVLVAGCWLVGCSSGKNKGTRDSSTDQPRSDLQSSDATKRDAVGDRGPTPDSHRADVGASDQNGGADRGADQAAPADLASTDGGSNLPRLGLFTVRVDGTQLTMLVDTGIQQLTHIRVGPSDWLTATRYTVDVDQNGLAMESEGGARPHYAGTQVVVFRQTNPSDVTVISGGVTGKLCANSSWTQDGKLLYRQQDDPQKPTLVRIKRASFLGIPVKSQTEVLQLPSEVTPLAPMQWGRAQGAARSSLPARPAMPMARCGRSGRCRPTARERSPS
jgi:hypothetical protein